MPSTINASTTLGLVNSADTSGILQLQTANTTALTVDASQNVGVGMTPVYKLDVTGGNGNAIRFTDSVNSVQVAMGAFNSQGFFGTLSNHPQLFYVNSGEGMRLTSTGLGIGTSSPTAKLHVAASGSQLRIGSTNTAYYWDISREGIIAGNLEFANAGGGSATTRMVLDAVGNLGLGVTPSAWSQGKGFELSAAGYGLWNSSNSIYSVANTYYNGGFKYASTAKASNYFQYDGTHAWSTAPSGTAGNAISFTQAMTLDASGNLLVGKTSTTFSAVGTILWGTGQIYATASASDVIRVNRLVDDGELIGFNQDGTKEGNISVSGTTVSYNGGHLSRWTQTTTAKDESLVKGTVLSNLDEMNVYTKDGQPVANEQLNKVKVSDTEGDVNIAGVFVNWSHDEEHNVDEINMAMTGDMIIRIAQGVTVVRGDLLMSAGDGTAKPQGDDIVRSKTVAKVTSNHITCTYADGSYCVPCVLMAC